jgi:ELWxxDGT repeat protein
MTLPRRLCLPCLFVTLFGFIAGSASASNGRATLVKDIRPGSNSGMSLSAIPSVAFNGILYFSADDGVTGTELWRTDGTAAGTFLVKDLNPGSDGSFPSGVAVLNGALLFIARTPATGTELWRSDGTDGGTVLVKDINAGASNGALPIGPAETLTMMNNLAFFVADNGTNGRELWKSDGTNTGTVIVKDAWSGLNHGMLEPTAVYRQFVQANGLLYFAADNGVAGYELWKSDGTTAGTVLVEDITPGSVGSNLFHVGAVNGVAVFLNFSGVLSIWKSDGTAAGTHEIKSIGFTFIDCVQSTGVALYFYGTDSATGGEIWKTDGTAAGTVLLKDIMPGTNGSNPCPFAQKDGVVFFAASETATGREVWRTDGTPAGTTLLKDLVPGATSSVTAGVAAISLDDLILFTAQPAAGSGAEVWRSDGTAAGTFVLADIRPGTSGSNAFYIGAAGGSVFMSAADEGTFGRELWRIARQKSDFDGEGIADVTVYRPASGQWWINKSGSSFTSSVMVPWGLATDQPVPSDFDGDGKVDPTVFRPGAGGNSFWFVRRSLTGYADGYAVHWGTEGDQPVPGFYDTDGRADPAVFRPSTGQWLINRSSAGYATGFAIEWGVASDIPVPADYDGDSRTDIAIYRPATGQWFIKRSTTEFATAFVVQWGINAEGDVPMPGDYDGDGKADPAVYRPGSGLWLITRSELNYSGALAFQWGVQASGDVPMPADYDGDGKVDPTIYRPGTGQWFMLKSFDNYSAFQVVQWGNQGLNDLPIRER